MLMIKYCELYWSFFKIGTFTIGGGYAMLPLMQREVVEQHRWMDDSDFLDVVALAQSMPGVFAVNVAALTGYRLRGLAGAAAAIMGNVMMPIVFILLLAMFFGAFRDNPVVERIFLGLRPAVVALIAAPVFDLWRKEIGKLRSGDGKRTLEWLAVILIPLLTALLVWLLGVNPILVVVGAAMLGLLFGKHKSH